MKFIVTPATGFVLGVGLNDDLTTAVTADYVTALVDGISPIADGSFSIKKSSILEIIANSASKGLVNSGPINVDSLSAIYTKGVAAVKTVWTVTVPAVVSGNYGKVVSLNFNFPEKMYGNGSPRGLRDNQFAAVEIVNSTSTVVSITTSLMKQINTRLGEDVVAVDGATLVVTAKTAKPFFITNSPVNSTEDVVQCGIVNTTPFVLGLNTQVDIAATELFESGYLGNESYEQSSMIDSPYQSLRATEFAPTTVFDTLRLMWRTKDTTALHNGASLPADFTIAAPTGAAGLATLYNFVNDVITGSNATAIAAGSVASGKLGSSQAGDVN